MIFTILKYTSHTVLIALTIAWLAAVVVSIATKSKPDAGLRTLGASVLWIPAMYARFWLVIIGLPAAFLGLVADGQYHTPAMWRFWGQVKNIPQWWTDKHGEGRFWKWWWMAVRNPTEGLAAMFKQPILEPRPNPDIIVYGGDAQHATRWLTHGLFTEFWYLRAIGTKKFEFRVGWKFADGTPGFTPTTSIRYGS